jgi:hypothetical protein
MQYSSLLHPFVSYNENEVLWIQPLRPYSQHNLQMAPKSKSVRSQQVFKPYLLQYFSLLRPLVSYKENEVIWIQFMRTYSQHFIFFITCEWVQQGRVFVPGMFLQPSVMKHPSLLHRLVSYKENGV